MSILIDKPCFVWYYKDNDDEDCEREKYEY